MSITAAWSGGGGAWSVLVHGGAGALAASAEAAHEAGCRRAAMLAAAILSRGGAALEAVQRAVEALEDDSHFNAGTGACLTLDGGLELDAALMEGRSLRAGAVCALPPFKNPIAIARAVLEHGEHVLFAGAGAARFARSAGFSEVDPATMITEAARTRLAQALGRGRASVWSGGTVGAVARDSAGDVAAATSTGGMVAKHPGRVGDSPILGAGTYADNRGGAASATGQGEGILRAGLTAQIVYALRSGAEPEAAARAAMEELALLTRARGGVIVVNSAGKLAFARSTASMSWAAQWDTAPLLSGL